MVVIGTQGHATDLLSDGSIFKNNDALFFFDSVTPLDKINIKCDYPIISSFSELSIVPQEHKRFILALGGGKNRHLLYHKFIEYGFYPANFISPYAMLAGNSGLSDGLNIMPFSSVFGDVQLGTGVLINSYSSIHHNTFIDSFTEVSPGCRILGRVKIGKFVQIGSSATVLPGIAIGDNSIIGAGSIVTKNIPSNSLAVGTPAKVIKSI